MKKFDVIQRREISSVFYAMLTLLPAGGVVFSWLEARRKEHAINLVDDILEGRCQPALSGFVRKTAAGEILSSCATRINVHGKEKIESTDHSFMSSARKAQFVHCPDTLGASSSCRIRSCTLSQVLCRSYQHL